MLARSRAGLAQETLEQLIIRAIHSLSYEGGWNLANNGTWVYLLW